MKNLTTYYVPGKARSMWLTLGLALISIFGVISKSVAQTFATEPALSGLYSQACPLGDCGPSVVSTPENARTSSTSTSARLFSRKAVLGVQGANAFITLRFPSNLPAGKTVFVRISEPQVGGLVTGVLGLVGLLDNGRITAQLLSGATATSDGTAVTVGSTRLLRDVAGNYYIGVTPAAATATPNAVRINVIAPSLDVVSSVDVNVFHAFYYPESTTEPCRQPIYTSLGEVSGVLNVSLGSVVANPINAIDNDLTSASAIGAGGVNIGALSSLSQHIYFQTPVPATQQAVVYLSFGTSLVDVNLLNGVSVQALNGEQSAGNSLGISSLLSANVLNLIQVNGIPANTVIPFYYTPTSAFDRIRISLNNTVDASLLGQSGIRVFGVGAVPVKPTVSKSLIYQFSGATPDVTATGPTGSVVFWQGPLPSSTTLNPAAGSNTSAFPSPVTANGDFVATAKNGSSCLYQSDSTRLRVIVVTDNSTAIPTGVGSDPYASNVAIRAVSVGHVITYSATGLPTGLSINATNGNLTVSGALPDVTETTQYQVEVSLFVDGVDSGLKLNKTITVNPKLRIPGGTFPFVYAASSTYSIGIAQSVTSANTSGEASGGRTGSTLSYSLTPPSARVTAVPSTFDITSTGILSGNPSTAGSGLYEFTVYVTDGEQVSQNQYFLRIESSLPVTLRSFDARAEGTTTSLSWVTTEETNSDRFDIERSQNGKIWSKIGSVKSNGESNSVREYAFSDANPIGGKNFYRLKMIDLDESFTYSQIKNVSFENTSFVSPNPVRADETLKLTLTDWSKVKSVQVINTMGKTVFESSNALSTGISARNLAAGAYIIKVLQNDGTVLTHRFVRQ